MKFIIYLLPFLLVPTAIAQESGKTKEDLILQKLMELQNSINGINTELRKELNNAIKEIKSMRAELDTLKTEKLLPKSEEPLPKTKMRTPKATETRSYGGTSEKPLEKSTFTPAEKKKAVHVTPVVYPVYQQPQYYYYYPHYYYPCR